MKIIPSSYSNGKTKYKIKKEKSQQEDEDPKEHLRWDYILLLLEFAFAYYLLDMKMWLGIPAEGKWWVEYTHGRSEFSNCALVISQDPWVGCVCGREGGELEPCLPLSMLQNELSFYILGFLKKKSA